MSTAISSSSTTTENASLNDISMTSISSTFDCFDPVPVQVVVRVKPFKVDRMDREDEQNQACLETKDNCITLQPEGICSTLSYFILFYFIFCLIVLFFFE